MPGDDDMAMNTVAIEQLLNEEESTSLDFKRDQYPFDRASDEEKSELLKDVLAFANSWRRSDAFILVGVLEVRGARSRPVGVATQLDDARLQQFVNSKTQRPIRFSYTPAVIDGVSIGIISLPIQERPFYLTKDYGKLQRHVVYIRRGSSTGEAAPDEVATMRAVAVGTGRPELSVVLQPVKRRDSQFVIGIANAEGLPAARAPFLSFELPDGFKLALHGLDGNGNDGLPQLPEPGSEWQKPKFKANTDVVIHGGTTHLVTRIERDGPLTGSFAISYEIAAENAELTRGVVNVAPPPTA